MVLLAPPLRLLTFQAPEYEMDASPRARALADRARAAGLQAGPRRRRHLQIEVRRQPGDGRPRPAPACTSRSRWPTSTPRSPPALSLRVYNATQSRIHVIVTYGFLRSLARLDLAESRVGSLADAARA